MRYNVRFRIDNRLGKGSVYTLRDICVALVERYSLREKELEQIVNLPVNHNTFHNNDMEIRRIK